MPQPQINNHFFKSISSWDDFVSTLLPLSKKEKGDAFELLTKYFFLLHPVYSFYDNVWMLSEVPQKELEYLGLPSHDLGIDLIAKDGNEYHAIQCKYHSDKNKSVTFKEVSTFTTLVESNSKISQGYICSSALSTSKNLDKVNKGGLIKLLADTWGGLDEEFFKNLNQKLNGRKTKLTPYTPREHQKKALVDATQHFVTNKQTRGKLIFPCGAGKSLTGYWIIRELNPKSTIIAVPSLSLVKQTLEVYLREMAANGTKVKWLCICSDEGIGRNDDVAFFTDNLGVPCQTDPTYIENWLKDNKDENKVIFTTYQSGRIIAELSKKLKMTFDVGIFDEAHKTVGADTKLFSHLLFEKNINISKRVFMTATERFYAGSRDDIISMDDEDIYGETFTQMSFKEAIELELLTDYKVITIDVKKSEIAEFIKDNNLVQLNSKWKKETEARSLASMLALRKAMKQFNINHAVSFHSSIEKATRSKELQRDITDTYNYQPIDTYTVSGKIPTTKRNDIVQEFAKSPKALITNARCLTEGVDVPNIDCIVFADPRKSRVDIVQALGRALRKKEGKDWGYVILPVVYDEVTGEIDNDNFNEILSIVRGLAANDERIIEYFKDKSLGEGSKESFGGAELFSMISETLSESDLAEQLSIKIWEKLSRFNWLPFEEAKSFVHKLALKSEPEWRVYIKSKNRHLNIPTSPWTVYKDRGWVDWGDWLGTGNLHWSKESYLNFKDAREFVQILGFKSQKEWYKYCKSGNKPANLPRTVDRTYRDEWTNWGDFLGSGRVANKDKIYRTYGEALKFSKNLNLKNASEWRSFTKSPLMPIDIPKTPEGTYKNEWESWAVFLGTENLKNIKYKDFKSAKEFAHKLNLKTEKDWNAYAKSNEKPPDIPHNVRRAYNGKGWNGMKDFLGADPEDVISRYNWLSYEEAKKLTIKMNLTSMKDWFEYTKSKSFPENIPIKPDWVYRNSGWKSWGDFLGTGNIASFNKVYLSYNEAQHQIRKLKLKGWKGWRIFTKSKEFPNNIPKNPHSVYKNKGWSDMSTFLGDKVSHKKTLRSRKFVLAREFVRSLNLTSGNDWKKYCESGKKPFDIPKTPNSVYKNKGWKGWADFLGK
ncbi:DEAD/DEAH box helicase family protein [Flavobacteriaceae bacterium]|nr:DEAD/DEAH box helicase family protein [Flavobacteriaceae bacterium]